MKPAALCFVPIEPRRPSDSIAQLIARADDLLNLSALRLLSVDSAALDTRVDRAQQHSFDFTSGAPCRVQLRLWYDANAAVNSSRETEQAIALCLSDPEAAAARAKEKQAHIRIRLAYVEIKPMLMQGAGTSERLTSLCKRANELLDAVALVPISIESASVDAKVRFISELRICADPYLHDPNTRITRRQHSAAAEWQSSRPNLYGSGTMNSSLKTSVWAWLSSRQQVT